MPREWPRAAHTVLVSGSPSEPDIRPGEARDFSDTDRPMLHLIIGLALFFLTLALIIVRPRGVTEATAALGGAVALLLGGYIRPLEALGVLGGEWNVYG